jgi:hypothetical protein
MEKWRGNNDNGVISCDYDSDKTPFVFFSIEGQSIV